MIILPYNNTFYRTKRKILSGYYLNIKIVKEFKLHKTIQGLEFGVIFIKAVVESSK